MAMLFSDVVSSENLFSDDNVALRMVFGLKKKRNVNIDISFMNE